VVAAVRGGLSRARWPVPWRSAAVALEVSRAALARTRRLPGGAGWRERLRAGPAVVDQERAGLVRTAAVEAPRWGPDSE